MASRIVASIVLLAFVAAPALAEVAVPALAARVTDLAGLLGPDDIASLESRLAGFERETTHQVAVLTLPSLEGEPIESVAIRVAEAWQLGQRGVDNGVLLLVAPVERRVRIEVGYGLEGVLPDVVAKRIIEKVITPAFRRGEMAGGILAGVDAILDVVSGEAVPALERRTPLEGENPLTAVLFAIVFGGVWGRGLGSLGRGLGTFGRGGGALIGGAIAAGLTYFWLASAGFAVVAGLAGFVFGLWWPAVGLGRGGGVGGYESGGLGGGGGFSGGGGGFGGGGASGGW